MYEFQGWFTLPEDPYEASNEVMAATCLRIDCGSLAAVTEREDPFLSPCDPVIED